MGERLKVDFKFCNFAHKLHHYLQQDKLGMQALFVDSCTAEGWVHFVDLVLCFLFFCVLSSNVSTNYTAFVWNMENAPKYQNA